MKASTSQFWFYPKRRVEYNAVMNATAEHLDQFLQKADPSVARTVEAVVQQLLQLHSARADNFPARQPSANYQFPTRSLGVRPGIDLTRLAHFDEDQ